MVPGLHEEIHGREGVHPRNIEEEEMLEKVWSPRPIQSVMVEILQKKGAMTDVDLHKELNDSFGEVSFREVNRALMKLELTGIVRVSRLLKKKRRVELAKDFSAN